ncbi:Type IV secretion system protein virB9 precursor [compost metagenome]
MEGETVVVHETAKGFVLRLGDAVLGVRNDGYAPQGKFNASGTSVPGMVRVSREAGGV